MTQNIDDNAELAVRDRLAPRRTDLLGDAPGAVDRLFVFGY